MGARRLILMIDKRTRKVIRRFPTASIAGKALNLDKKTAYSRALRKQVTADNFYLRFEDEFDPNESFEGQSNCPVVVRDEITEEERWFSTRTEAAKALVVIPATISAAIKRGNLVLYRYSVRTAPLKEGE